MAALIILNGPRLPPRVLELTWPKSTQLSYPVICADGGTNLLRSQTLQQTQEYDAHNSSARVPTSIVGDLDSVTEENLDHYRALGTKIVKDPDQDSNDFQKSLLVAKSQLTDSGLPIVVIGGFGGRIDQTLGNLNTLFCHAQEDGQMIWLDDRNVIIALSSGRHRISIDRSRDGPICGLIPIGVPVEEVTTSGLKWNLSAQKLSYGIGEIVSSSNEVTNDYVTIQTSSPLMFTLEWHLN